MGPFTLHMREEDARTYEWVLSDFPSPKLGNVPHCLVLKSVITRQQRFSYVLNQVLKSCCVILWNEIPSGAAHMQLEELNIWYYIFLLKTLVLVSLKFICCKILYSHNGCVFTGFYRSLGTELTCLAFIWQNFTALPQIFGLFGFLKILPAINNRTATSTECSYKPAKFLMCFFRVCFPN